MPTHFCLKYHIGERYFLSVRTHRIMQISLQQLRLGVHCSDMRFLGSFVQDCEEFLVKNSWEFKLANDYVEVGPTGAWLLLYKQRPGQNGQDIFITYSNPWDGSVQDVQFFWVGSCC